MEAAFGNVEQLFANLEPDPEQPAAAAGNPTWRYAALTEGAIDSGVWSSTEGSWNETDYTVNEVMVITEGHLRITNADGSVHDLHAGDMFFLPKGWAGTWHVVEAMKKIYFIVA